MMMPEISVIIPIYNAEKYLKVSIENLLKQTFDKFEIILVNDGSTDSSGEICDYFKLKYENITVVHKVNEGAGPARNKGIEIAKGKYIMFYDADDILENDMLENMYQEIEKKKTDLVICSHKDINFIKDNIDVKRENKVQKRDIYGIDNVRKNYVDLYKEGIIQAPWAKLYKIDIIRKNNIKFPSLKRCQDIVFNVKYYGYIKSLSVMDNMYYLYLTPDGQTYLNKFPKDMFNIIAYVNEYIVNSLKKWNVLDEDAKRYFSSNFIRETAMCLRLCLNPKWNMSKAEKKDYINSIVKNNYLNESLSIEQNNNINKLIKVLIRSKTYFIIDKFNKLTLLYSKLLNN